MEKSLCRFALHLLLIIVSSLTSQIVIAQETFTLKKGTIYIIRHAEKAEGNDPVLSEEGYKRSGSLFWTFTHTSHLKRIYVSQFKRTQLTADSLRIKLNIDTVHYVADVSGDGLITALKNHKNDRNILIIGHSNTIPVIIKRLGILNTPITIGEDEYDNLFKIIYKNGKPTLYRKVLVRFPGANTPRNKI